jgi:hypothetical protein
MSPRNQDENDRSRGTIPFSLELELLAAIGLLSAALEPREPEELVRAVQVRQGPAYHRAIATPFVRIVAAAIPAVEEPASSDPFVGRGCAAELATAWDRATGLHQTDTVVEALFGAYRAAVHAVCDATELPAERVHDLVVGLSGRIVPIGPVA